MRAIRFIAPILILFVITTPLFALSAPGPTPERVLTIAGLSTSPPELLKYLKEGIPSDFTHPNSGRGIGVPDRFDLYFPMVELLDQQHSQATALLLTNFVAGNLPPAMQTDLDTCVEPDTAFRSEDDRKRYTKLKLDPFRYVCAWKLDELTGQSAIPFTEQLLLEWTTLLLQEVDKGYPRSDYAHLKLREIVRFYRQLCSRLTSHGAKSGIDSLIATLDHPNTPAVTPNVLLLREFTGQYFGPEFDDTPKIAKREVEHWKVWWQTNRNLFIPIARPQTSPARPISRSQPQKLRDTLVASLGYSHPYYGDGSHEPTGGYYEALDRQAPQQLGQLRKIVDDPEERPSVRSQALYFYARHAGAEGIRTLERYADLPDSPQTYPITRQAVGLLQYFESNGRFR